MKLIIAGTRTLKPDYGFILSTIKMLQIEGITEIISGGASGVDSEGEHFASHMELPVKQFLADWESFGRSAGPVRNKEMAEYGDALLLIWDGQSRGSAHMKHCMVKACKPIFEVIISSTHFT